MNCNLWQTLRACPCFVHKRRPQDTAVDLVRVRRARTDARGCTLHGELVANADRRIDLVRARRARTDARGCTLHGELVANADCKIDLVRARRARTDSRGCTCFVHQNAWMSKQQLNKSGGWARTAELPPNSRTA